MIFAGVTSTAAGGFGAGAATGAGTAAAVPALEIGAELPPTDESLASTVLPLKFFSRWMTLVVGGELIGESSAIVDTRGGSLIGEP
jgi:hypothetical protein